MMQIYLVGGAVRDKLLGLPVKERDWVVVGAQAQTLIARGYRQVGRDFPVFLHPDTQEEYALARTERKSGKGHQGFIVHSSPEVTLEQDLLRRDLTINAIAEDAGHQLIDPYDGLSDLKQHCLRHISPAFAEDPLRVFRVARFAARFHDLGFFIADETLQLMSQLCVGDELKFLSKERIWRETEKALACHSPQVYFDVLKQVGAIGFVSELFKHQSPSDQLNRLNQVHNQQSRYIALCLLCVDADQNSEAQTNSAKLQQLQEHFFASQNLQDICSLIVENNLLKLNTDTLNAEQIYQLIQRLDALRRPERLQELIKHMRHLENLFNEINMPSFEFLSFCIQQLTELKLDPASMQTLKGKAIGLALEKVRIEKITCLKQNT